MANGTDDAIKRVLEGEELPPRVTNQLILGIMLQSRADFTEYRRERMEHDAKLAEDKTKEQQELLTRFNEIYERLSRIDKKQDELVEQQEKIVAQIQENPSITWLLRYRTSKAVGIILVVFLVLLMSFALSHPTLEALYKLLNLVP